ncbi:MAG: histidine kinase [Chthoniobacterales bacterium]|nr:histidine kinase [Chthoniobacterales bacterium]
MQYIPAPRSFALRLAILGTAIFLATSVATAWQKSGNPDFPVPVWTACAIALAGMWIWGRGMWPALFVPLAASAWFSGAPWQFVLLAPAAIAICIVLACRWLAAKNFDASFAALQDTTVFLTRGALFPMLLAGIGTSMAMSLAGILPWKSAPTAGLVYGIAYAAGCAVLTPAILLAAKRRPLAVPWEAALPLVCLALSVWLSFSGVVPKSGALLSYVPFPFLVWSAWKGGLPAAVAGALITVFAAIACSGSGGGPFAGAGGLGAFVQIETYVAVMATTALLTGSAAETTRRENELRLDAALRLAESERLKSQLQPHFLFNCLAAIHSLAETNPSTARAGIVALADLLRTSLDNTQSDGVTLEEEMQFVTNYVNLQRLRFEDSLDVSIQWDRNQAHCRIPPMLLQPLVENALKHGETKDGRLRVEVSVFSSGDQLCLRAGNNADESGEDPALWKEGTGLRNLRERLALVYGGQARLQTGRPQPGWIEVTVCINKSGWDESSGPR